MRGDDSNSIITDPDGIRFGIEQDAKHAAPLVATIEHHEIHEGCSYEVHVNSANADVAALNIAFKTLDSSKLAHMVFAWDNDDDILFEIIEGATWTQGTGTERAIQNHNLDTGGASVVILEDKGQATFTASNTVIQDVTGIAGGTVRDNQYTYRTGVGGTGGGESRAATHEWILKRNTTYIIRSTQTGGNCRMTNTLHWYEHTDRA